MPGGDPRDPGRQRREPERREPTKAQETAGERAQLERAKAKAVEDEDFVLAKLLQSRIEALDGRAAERKMVSEVRMRQSAEIAALEEQKSQAMKADDVDFAQCLQKEIEAWKEEHASRAKAKEEKVRDLRERQAKCRELGDYDQAMHFQEKIQDLEMGTATELLVQDVASAHIAEKLVRLGNRKAAAKAAEDFTELRRVRDDLEAATKELRRTLMASRRGQDAGRGRTNRDDADEFDENVGMLSIIGKPTDTGSFDGSTREVTEGGWRPGVLRVLCIIVPILVVVVVAIATVGKAPQRAAPADAVVEAAPSTLPRPEVPAADTGSSQAFLAPAPTEAPAPAAPAGPPVTLDQPMPEDLAPFEPVLGERGVRVCPKKTKGLGNKKECEKAAKLLGIRWVESPAAGGAGPKGCIIRNQAILWNAKEIAEWPAFIKVCKPLHAQKRVTTTRTTTTVTHVTTSTLPHTTKYGRGRGDHHPPGEFTEP